MDTKTCIYCESRFTTADREHILQNSLGARWVSDVIVCDECQSLFGRTIDSDLSHSFGWIRNLFEIRSGRNDDPPIMRRLETEGGRVVDLKPGGIPRLNKPHIVAPEVMEHSATGQISLGTLSQLEWAKKLLRDRYGNIEIHVGEMQTVSEPLGEFVKMNVSIGGPEYARAIVKACFNLYAACFPDLARRACFDTVRRFVREGIGNGADFQRWPCTPISFTKLSDLEHQIVIVNRGTLVEGAVLLFGHIHHSIRLCQTFDVDKNGCCSYVVDPLRERKPAEVKNSITDPGWVPGFSDQPSELNSEGQEHLAKSLSQLSAICEKRTTTKESSDFFVDVKLPKGPAPDDLLGDEQ